MKNTINKKKDLTFYKLSLGSMICGYIALGFMLIAVIIMSISVSDQPGWDRDLWREIEQKMTIACELLAVLAIFAMTILNIAQAVAHSHYGDIGNKLTKVNTQKIFIVCLSVLGGCLLLYFLWSKISWPKVEIEGRDPVIVWWADILDSIVSAIFVLGAFGSIVTHIGVNTAIVVKLHQPKK